MEWRAVPGFDGYEVSDSGSVRSRRKMLTPQILRGYLRVGLQQDGKRVNRFVHRLVLLAFVGPCPPGQEVLHGPGGPGDNRLANLRYGTSSENNLDAVASGTHYQASRVTCPRGHVLVSPNLVASAARQGRRSCLACNRAKSAVNRSDLSFQDLADGFYQKITG